MRRRSRVILGVLLGALFITGTARAVLVSPLAIFLDAQARSTEVALANTSPTAEEVTIDVRFGFPTTDSLTELPVTPTVAADSANPSAPSAARFLRVFPRRVVLQPGQTQLVRVFASPPPGLGDGEYWARFVATSKAVADTTRSPTEQVGITFAIATSVPIWYRKGAVRTAIAIDSFEVSASRDTLRARAVFARGGNAAWLGTAAFELLDARGRAVKEWPLSTGIFPARYRRRFSFGLDGVPAGAYTLQLTLRASRADLRPADVLPAPEVRRSVPLTIP